MARKSLHLMTLLTLFIPALCIIVFISKSMAQSAHLGLKIADERRFLLCHNPTGVNDHRQAPYLARQNIEYLVAQMNRFIKRQPAKPGARKTAERHHYFMDKQVQLLTQDEIIQIADFYSTFKCNPIRSDAVKKLPAPAKTKRCAFCHGEFGISQLTAVPNIAGQKKIYLIDQLTAFQNSAIHGSKESLNDKRYLRIMVPAVTDLTPSEIENIADYYSKQSCE